MLPASSDGRVWVRSHVSANPEGKLEVRKTNAAISPVCLRDRHLPNAPVNISGWKRGARQLTKKIMLTTLTCSNVICSKSDLYISSPECRIIGGTSKYGRPTGQVASFRNVQQDSDFSSLWTETATVPQTVPAVPREMLGVRYPSGVTIRPNDTVTTGLVSTSTYCSGRQTTLAI